MGGWVNLYYISEKTGKSLYRKSIHNIANQCGIIFMVVKLGLFVIGTKRIKSLYPIQNIPFFNVMHSGKRWW